jgi:5'-nucleotidase
MPAPSGDTLRIGLLGVTLSLTGADYVSYDDPLEVVRRQAALIRDSVHVLIAMTHLFLDQDIELVQEVPEIDLVVGGHDHENVQVWRGPHLTPIAKADANARSVYVDRLDYDFETGRLDIEVNLELITDEIPEDPETAAAVEYWVEQAWAGFRESGFAPSQPVATLRQSFDGRESVVRNGPTRLTRIILDGMRRAAGNVDVVFFNSGSIRLDDVLPPGPVSQYDVIRVLPFGGDIVTVDMSGALLDSVLTQGVINQGTGGYLQVDGASNEGGTWFVGPEPLRKDRRYSVALNDFLLLGIESGFETLTLDQTGIEMIADHGDIRLAVIAELKRLNM